MSVMMRRISYQKIRKICRKKKLLSPKNLKKHLFCPARGPILPRSNKRLSGPLTLVLKKLCTKFLKNHAFSEICSVKRMNKGTDGSTNGQVIVKKCDDFFCYPLLLKVDECLFLKDVCFRRA